MRSEELMQNDWVKLSKADIFCKVRSVLIDGHIVGETSSGGHFEQKAASLSPVDLTQDVILRTSFWMKKKNLLKKSVRGVAAFTYWAETGLLEVADGVTGHVNRHFVVHLHVLQQLYRHYTSMELEVDMTRNKRKEYGQKYNSRRKENDGKDEE